MEQVEDLCDGCSPSFLSLRSPGCRREVRQRLAQMAAMPVGRAVGLPLRAGGRGSLWVGPVPAAERPAQRHCSPGLLVCPCRFFVQMGRMAAAELRCAQTRGAGESGRVPGPTAARGLSAPAAHSGSYVPLLRPPSKGCTSVWFLNCGAGPLHGGCSWRWGRPSRDGGGVSGRRQPRGQLVCV